MPADGEAKLRPVLATQPNQVEKRMSKSDLSVDEQISSIWSLGGLTWRELARRVWGGINQNDLINRGYELAYNFLLAVFPLLLFLLALFGLFASTGGKLRHDLFSYLQLALPPSAYQLVSNITNQVALGATGRKLALGLVLALYSGSGGMTQLIATLNAAYEVREQRSWIRVRLTSIGLTLAMSMLTILALVLVLVGAQVTDLAKEVAALSTVAVVIVRALEWAIALLLIVFAFALIYYFAPDVEKQRWYWITPGSVVGVLVWFVASTVLRGYLHFFNTYNKTYGSLGAVIILMLWFYVTGLAFLIGGEINSTIEHAAAEHGHPEAKPVGEKAEAKTLDQRAA